MSRYNKRTFWIALSMHLLPMAVIASSQALENKLIDAVIAGRLAEVRQLVSEDFDLNKSSALQVAADSGQLDIVKFLIEKGADPSGLLMQHGYKSRFIFTAAKEGRPEMLEYVVSHGANLNYERPGDTSMSSTPLIAAVRYGDLDAVRLLIEYGADVNYVSRHGNTALMQAAQYSGGDGENDKSAESIELLLANGADPDIPDRNGISVRQYVVLRQRSDLNALIERVKPKPSGAVVLDAADFQAMTVVLTTKGTCDQKLLGFKEASESAYLAWRERNAASIEQIEDSPGFQEELAQMRQNEKASTRVANPAMENRDLSMWKELCEDVVLEQLTKDPDTGPDPNLATPELTWKHFVDSLRTADRKAALSCLASTARSKFRDLINSQPEDQLRRMAESIRSFQLTARISDDIVEGYVARNDGAAGMIYFQKDNDEWKISEM